MAPGARVTRSDINPQFRGRPALRICLQTRVTGGRDGIINHGRGAMNPQGCRAAHDFPWRAYPSAPVCGEVVIFNRAHDEEVQVVGVHERVGQDV